MTSTQTLAQQRPSVGAADAPSQSQTINAIAEAEIATIIESVGSLADRHDFEALVQVYAPEVDLDYTSLVGGEPEVVSNSELMNRWAAMLPGFDRTRHDISDVSVSVTGNQATATASVIADHWIGGQHWQVSGDYLYLLERGTDGWQITAHRFTMSDETGSRDVFALASEAAAAEPVDWLRRQRSQQVILDFLEGLEEIDMDRVNGVWAEDAVQEMPFAPRGVNFPDRVEGRDALIAQYAGWPDNARNPDYTSELRFLPTTDPDLIIVEYRGITEIVPTKRTYDQKYIGVFHIDDDGKIALFREYFDPTVFVEAFGMGEEGGAQ